MIGRVVDTGAFSNQWQQGYSVAKLYAKNVALRRTAVDFL